MNRQTFLNYLEEPAKLYQMSLVELQGLVLEYPYSANLRLLLLLKARLEDHPRQEEMLAQLASRTFDRAYLYDFIRDLDLEERQKVEFEERLELPELDKLEFVFNEPAPLESAPSQAPRAVEIPSSSIATSLANTPPPPPVHEEVLEDMEKDGEETKVNAVASSQTISIVVNRNNLLQDAIAISEILSRLTIVRNETLSLEKATENPLKRRLQRHRKKQLKRLKNEQRDRIKEIVRKSVRPQQETASETLAKLLAHQGQYAQSIKMYEQLSLLNPEKSAKFARRIKKLKEKL